MKKILALVVVLIAVGQVSAIGIAPKSPVGTSVVKSGAIVKLFYRGEHSGNVKVKIYNEMGQMVFSETMEDKEHFMRPYNFSSLPEGEYTIELSDEKGKRFHTVSHSTKKVKTVAHLTRLKGDDNRYLLTIPNEGRNALTIRIFDNSKELVYQDTQVIDGNFAKVYNLDKIEGQHTFEIIDRQGNVNRLTKARR